MKKININPQWFGILSMVGFLGSNILTARATYRTAQTKGFREKEEKKLDYAKRVYKGYIPSAICFTGCCALILLQNRLYSNRIETLASLYSATDSAYRLYQAKTKAVVGDKKEEEIRSEVDKEYVKKTPVQIGGIYGERKEGTLCFDKLSGRYFYSDQNTIKRLVNELNERILKDEAVCLNDWYYELGLGPIENGYDAGWGFDMGDVRQLLEVTFTSQLDSNENPALVLTYRPNPIY